jgi:hypothetical protein
MTPLNTCSAIDYMPSLQVVLRMIVSLCFPPHSLKSVPDYYHNHITVEERKYLGGKCFAPDDNLMISSTFKSASHNKSRIILSRN